MSCFQVHVATSHVSPRQEEQLTALHWKPRNTQCARMVGFMLCCLQSWREGACYKLCGIDVTGSSNTNTVYTLCFQTLIASLNVWTTISSSYLGEKKYMSGFYEPRLKSFLNSSCGKKHSEKTEDRMLDNSALIRQSGQTVRTQLSDLTFTMLLVKGLYFAQRFHHCFNLNESLECLFATHSSSSESNISWGHRWEI